MSCRSCEYEPLETYVRVGNGNVMITGCWKHLKELLDKYNAKDPKPSAVTGEQKAVPKASQSWNTEARKILKELVTLSVKWNDEETANQDLDTSLSRLTLLVEEKIVGKDESCEKGHKEYFEWCSYCDIERHNSDLRAEMRAALKETK